MTTKEGSFYGFIGQKQLVGVLREHVDGALRLNQPFPNVGLAGPSGAGKTALCECLAKAMGTDLLPFWATPASKRWQVAKLIGQAKPHDIVMVDEAHNIGGVGGVAEVLYRCTDPERPQVPLVEDDRIVENSWVPLPRITVCLLSDNLGMLPRAALERMCLRLTMQPYAEDELKTIAGHYAAKSNVLLSPQGCRELARSCRGSPRRIRHLLQSLSTCLENPGEQVSKKTLRRHLEMLGFEDYLEPSDRAYLGVLARRGGSVALDTLAAQIGLDSATVRRDVEPLLIRRELISVESRGRALTLKGQVYCQERKLA